MKATFTRRRKIRPINLGLNYLMFPVADVQENIKEYICRYRYLVTQQSGYCKSNFIRPYEVSKSIILYSVCTEAEKYAPAKSCKVSRVSEFPLLQSFLVDVHIHWKVSRSSHIQSTKKFKIVAPAMAV
ncbi:14627_t:CDS:2 [Funneliformis mosseae]|uniref:14627_t:CDS:1 n=1 Tax=Funneliformis mosseae TaxID=27381 RepID=A0A9N9B0V5_FUNMO|nr:14627_t:CDS:2 [Funneliformis mosseae]